MKRKILVVKLSKPKTGKQVSICSQAVTDD